MAKQLENVFTLADLQGHFTWNFHAKDLKPRIIREDKETTSKESDVEPEDRYLAPAEKTRVSGSQEKIPKEKRKTKKNYLCSMSRTYKNNKSYPDQLQFQMSSDPRRRFKDRKGGIPIARPIKHSISGLR